MKIEFEIDDNKIKEELIKKLTDSLLDHVLVAPDVSWEVAQKETRKRKEEILKRTEFIDDYGNVFYSAYGVCNALIQSALAKIKELEEKPKDK